MSPYRFSCFLAGLVLILAALAAPALGQGEIGYVRIASSPGGAVIYIDDIYRGATPISQGQSSAIVVSANTLHTVRLAKQGYYDYATTFTVGAGQYRDISWTLVRTSQTSIFGTIAVQSTPGGAAVYIDGTYYGTTPTGSGSVNVVSYPAGASVFLDDVYRGVTNPWDALDIPDVAPGEHDLTLTLGGYYDYVTTVTVPAGSETSVVATLTDLPGANPNGQVAVSSEPSGAGIYIDTVYRGITPQIVDNVPKGSHTLLVRQAGYQDWTTQVQVTEGETAQVSATLATGGTATATTTLITGATTAAPTPTTPVPTTTRSRLADWLALGGLALAGPLIVRARR